MTELVALKPKQYAFKVQDDSWTPRQSPRDEELQKSKRVKVLKRMLSGIS